MVYVAQSSMPGGVTQASGSAPTPAPPPGLQLVASALVLTADDVGTFRGVSTRKEANRWLAHFRGCCAKASLEVVDITSPFFDWKRYWCNLPHAWTPKGDGVPRFEGRFFNSLEPNMRELQLPEPCRRFRFDFVTHRVDGNYVHAITSIEEIRGAAHHRTLGAMVVARSLPDAELSAGGRHELGDCPAHVGGPSRLSRTRATSRRSTSPRTSSGATGSIGSGSSRRAPSVARCCSSVWHPLRWWAVPRRLPSPCSSLRRRLIRTTESSSSVRARRFRFELAVPRRMPGLRALVVRFSNVARMRRGLRMRSIGPGGRQDQQGEGLEGKSSEVSSGPISRFFSRLLRVADKTPADRNKFKQRLLLDVMQDAD